MNLKRSTVLALSCRRASMHAIFAALLFAAYALAATPVEAQASRRIDLPADLLAQLTRGLSAESRAAVEKYLASDPGDDLSFSGISMSQLAQDPAARDFLLAVLPKEPVPAVRVNIVSFLPRAVKNWKSQPQVAEALLERLRRDPDKRVAATAMDVLRKREGLEQVSAALTERIALARKLDDLEILTLALEEHEDVDHIMDGVYAPPFLRTPPPPFTVASAGRAISVLAFGDFGRAHLPQKTHQLELAQVMRAYHARSPFSFGITTGDNFYATSFPTPTDPRWKISWDQPYGPLGIPFYVSLGNHDWAEGAGPMAQYVYAQTSRSWKLPALYYTYMAGPAQFFAVNTNALTERQLEWLRKELAVSRAKWKVVYGHFPAYEQTNYGVARIQELLVPIFNEYQVDLYLCGHRHNLQHWQKAGIDYVVTGAGGEGDPPRNLDQNIEGRKFLSQRAGFVDLRIGADALEIRFIGSDVLPGGKTSPEDPGAPPPTAQQLTPKLLYQHARRK